MSEKPAGIIASTSNPVHQCNIMPDWEAEILGTPKKDHARLVLQARRECGNAHPQQMFDPNPKVSRTIGIVFAREVESGDVKVDDRDVVIMGRGAYFLRWRFWHVTWRNTDQHLPGKGMLPIGLVILRANGRKQFRPFDEIGTIILPLSKVRRYVEAFPSTNY